MNSQLKRKLVSKDIRILVPQEWRINQFNLLAQYIKDIKDIKKIINKNTTR
jgi:hypothetical protein